MEKESNEEKKVEILIQAKEKKESKNSENKLANEKQSKKNLRKDKKKKSKKSANYSSSGLSSSSSSSSNSESNSSSNSYSSSESGSENSQSNSHRRKNRSRSKSKGTKSKVKDKSEIKYLHPSHPTEIPQTTGLTGDILQNMHALSIAQATKIDRKIFITNLPEGVPTKILMDLFNKALIQMNCNIKRGRPILNLAFSADKSYAFAEFRTAEEARRGYALKNISVLDHRLSVSKPMILTGFDKDGNPVLNSVTLADALMINNLQLNKETNTFLLPDPTLIKDRVVHIQVPSRILRLTGIYTLKELINETERVEIEAEVKEECKKFGNVISAFTPVPSNEEEENTFLPRIYIEFSSIDEAQKARRQLHYRKYANKLVGIHFYDEKKYAEKIFK